MRRMAFSGDSRPEFYLPFVQYPWRGCSLVVCSWGNHEPLVAAVRREIREIDPGFAACYFPCRQGMKVDPVTTLCQQ